MRSLIKNYILNSKIMQVATVDDNQPWICSVYYVIDDELNLYWLSLPSRRHSKEIDKNSKVAIAIAVKTEQPVIGIQAEGFAEKVSNPASIAEVMKKYTDKYSAGKDFYTNFIAGKNKHVLYKFKPTLFVLFDELNFTEPNSRQEWALEISN